MKSAHKLMITLAALVLPLSLANANVSLQWTAGSANAAPGSTVNISLQLVVTGSDAVNAIDYWLAQTSGPLAGAFDITGTTRGAGDFANVSTSDATATSATGDTFSNSAASTSGNPDSVRDRQINPRNGPDLGAFKTGDVNSPFTAGTYSVGTFTLQLAPSAAVGTSYTIAAFDYSGFGWSNTVTSSFDNAFSSLGSIQINVVPEPATWSLLGLGGLGAFGLNFLRSRRRLG